jgi:hypothetical protein
VLQLLPELELVPHRDNALDVPDAGCQSSAVSWSATKPDNVTTPDDALTATSSGPIPNSPAAMFLTSARMSASARSYTPSTSARLMMPVSSPPRPTTGSRFAAGPASPWPPPAPERVPQR